MPEAGDAPNSIGRGRAPRGVSQAQHVVATRVRKARTFPAIPAQHGDWGWPADTAAQEQQNNTILSKCVLGFALQHVPTCMFSLAPERLLQAFPKGS